MDAATAPPVETGPQPSAPAWHTVGLADVFERQGVDATTGLTAAEVVARRDQHGANRLAEAAKEPRWRAFVRQYADPMQIVLLVAGIGSFWPIKQYGTGLVILFLTLVNAVIGLRQEGKAAAAVAALQKMMIIKAKVRRDGAVSGGARRGARAGRHSRGGGRRCRPGRRPHHPRCDARGRRGGAHG